LNGIEDFPKTGKTQLKQLLSRKSVLPLFWHEPCDLLRVEREITMFIPPKNIRKDEQVERYEPLPLTLELPLPEDYPPVQREDDEKTDPERGVWTIDI